MMSGEESRQAVGLRYRPGTAWGLGYNRNLLNRLRQMEFCVDLLNSDVDARSTTFAGIGIHEDCS